MVTWDPLHLVDEAVAVRVNCTKNAVPIWYNVGKLDVEKEMMPDTASTTDGPKWPSYFPENCPPPTSKDAAGECFRITTTNQLIDDDFKSYLELNIPTTAPMCLRCGVSIYTSFEQAKRMLLLRPKIGTHVAKGTLNQDHGKWSDPSPSGHREWWPYADIDRKSCFDEPQI